MSVTKISISAIVTAFFAWLTYYFALPAMTFSSPGMWWYFLFVGVVLTICLGIGSAIAEDEFVSVSISGGICAVILIVIIIGSIAGGKMFNAKDYHARLDVETTTFEEAIPEVDWNTIPQIDKDSSSILGNRKMGTLINEVSQYNVMDNYTQINYENKPVRVSPLGYAGIGKYNNNKHDGIPGYIIVDGVTKEAEFVRLEKGMKYSPSAYFGKDLRRYLRRNFRTTLFDIFSFEIDDEGNPYYVVPTYKYTAGIGGVKVPTGCILVDPITGDLEKYDMDEIPQWIDHSLAASHVVDMIDTWGIYGGGYLNKFKIFGQKNVRKSTEGYNYITIDDDVYLYTGITSVVQDESNIGFIMVNMRTGKAKYFDIASAEEYSAMDSAKGQVQHLNYDSTFPILINPSGIPTYFLSLKDAAGLVKMYGFVSVENIQNVSVTEANLGVEHGMNEYLKVINKNSSSSNTQKDKSINTDVTISEVFTASIEGNSYYYIVSSTGELYIANINTGKESLPLLKPGYVVNLTCYKSGEHYEVTDVSEYKNSAINANNELTEISELTE